MPGNRMNTSVMGLFCILTFKCSASLCTVCGFERDMSWYSMLDSHFKIKLPVNRFPILYHFQLYHASKKKSCTHWGSPQAVCVILHHRAVSRFSVWAGSQEQIKLCFSLNSSKTHHVTLVWWMHWRRHTCCYLYIFVSALAHTPTLTITAAPKAWRLSKNLKGMGQSRNLLTVLMWSKNLSAEK